MLLFVFVLALSLCYYVFRLIFIHVIICAQATQPAEGEQAGGSLPRDAQTRSIYML